jgi:two-component system, cell cycle response regulator
MALAAELPQRTVLIVDDSKFVRATFRSILQAKFAVREEADGEAGWRALENDPSIVLVFLDLTMPGLDGFEVLGLVRNSPKERIREMPVVVISGDEEPATKTRARDAGANDFIGKTADAPEVLARIDNLLRLVHARHEADSSRRAVEEEALRDPLTGVLTPHSLLQQGRKLFSHAQRHAGPLSILMLRIDSHPDTVRDFGKEVADQLLTRIAGVLSSSLRLEDSVGRTAEAGFTVISASTAAAEALAMSQRLREQLEGAQVKYQGQALPVRVSLGLASLGVDPVATVEELIKLALQRLKPGAPQASPRPAATLPADIERAVQVLERASVERLGEGSGEVLRRLLPFLQAAFRRLRIELPADKILHRMKDSVK